MDYNKIYQGKDKFEEINPFKKTLTTIEAAEVDYTKDESPIKIKKKKNKKRKHKEEPEPIYYSSADTLSNKSNLFINYFKYKFPQKNQESTNHERIIEIDLNETQDDIKFSYYKNSNNKNNDDSEISEIESEEESFSTESTVIFNPQMTKRNSDDDLDMETQSTIEFLDSKNETQNEKEYKSMKKIFNFFSKSSPPPPPSFIPPPPVAPDDFDGKKETKFMKIYRNNSRAISYGFNKLLLISISVFFLWVTTFNFSYYIANMFISSPKLSTVASHCQYAAQYSNSLSDKYETCVKNQLDICKKEVDKRTEMQNSYLQSNMKNNNLIYSNFYSNYAECTQANDNVKIFLTEFDKISRYSGEYEDDDDYDPLAPPRKLLESIPTSSPTTSNICTEEDEDAIQIALLSSNSTSSSSSNSLYKGIKKYMKTTTKGLTNVIGYVDTVNSYNYNYVKNKTDGILDISLNFLDNIETPYFSTINMEMDSISKIMEDLLACISLGAFEDEDEDDIVVSNGKIIFKTEENTNILNENRRKSLEGNSICPNMPSVAENFNIFTDSFNLKLHYFNQTIINFRVTLEDFVDDAKKISDKAMNFYKIIMEANGVFDYLSRNLPSFPGVGSLCSVTNPSVCDFGLNNFINLNIPEFPSFLYGDIPLDLPDIDRFWTAMLEIQIKNNFKLYKNMIKNMKLYLFDFDLKLKANFLDFGNILSDYDPPTYLEYLGLTSNSNETLIEEVERQKMLNFNYLNFFENLIYSPSDSIKNGIDLIGNAIENLELQEKIESGFEKSKSSIQNLAQKLKNVNTESIADSANYIFEEYFSNFYNLLIMLDILFRVFLTLQLIAYYILNSAVKLPIVDLKDPNKHYVENKIKEFYFISYVFYLFSFLNFMSFFLIILVILFILFTIFVIIPGYNAYINTCVYHQDTSTSLSHFLYLLSYNLASYSGDMKWSVGLMNLNYHSESKCNEIVQNNHNYNKNFIKNIGVYNNTMSQIIENNKLMEKCMDFDQVNKKILDLCCTEESFQDICNEYGYTTQIPKEISSCPAELKSLKNKNISSLFQNSKNSCSSDDLFYKKNITYISKLSYIPDELKEFYDIEGEIYKESLATYSLFHSSEVPTLFPTTYINSYSKSENKEKNSTINNNEKLYNETDFPIYSYSSKIDTDFKSPYFSFTDAPPSNSFLSSHYLHYLPVWNSKAHGNILVSNFDCKSFSKCELNCDVINKNSIKMTTRNCSCLTEFYFFSNLIKIFLIFLIFVISNVSRVVLLKGFKQIFWRNFVEPEVDLLIDTNSYGEVVFGALEKKKLKKKMKETEKNLIPVDKNELVKEVIAEKVDEELVYFERSGYFYVILAILVNGIWIYMLFYLKRDLVYRPFL